MDHPTLSPSRSGAALRGALGALVLAAATAPADEPATVRSDPSSPEGIRAAVERLRSEVESETANADRSVRVVGPALTFSERSVLLGFTEDLRAALEQQLGARGVRGPLTSAVAFRGPAYHLLVHAVEDPEGTNRVASISLALHPLRNEAALRTPPARLTIFNPENALDPHDFAAHVVDALLRLKVLYAAPPAAPGAPAPAPPPPWFAAGLARLQDASVRQPDFDAVRAQWFDAALPPLREMVGRDAPFPSADSAVAAQLAAFWLSFPDVPARFASLAARLGAGEPWSAALFLSTAVGTADERAGDRAFDAWLWDRDVHILTPGATTPRLVARTLVAMQLFPGQDGVPADWADRPQPLERLLEPEAAPWAAETAALLRARILRLSAGRGDAFREAAGLYAAALQDAAAGGRRARGAAARFEAARAAMTAAADPSDP